MMDNGYHHHTHTFINGYCLLILLTIKESELLNEEIWIVVFHKLYLLTGEKIYIIYF